MVAAHLGRHHPVGLAVPVAAGHVEGVVVVEDPDLRRLGGGFAFERQRLDEPAHPGHPVVDGVVEAAVEVERLREAGGAHGGAARVVAADHLGKVGRGGAPDRGRGPPAPRPGPAGVRRVRRIVPTGRPERSGRRRGGGAGTRRGPTKGLGGPGTLRDRWPIRIWRGIRWRHPRRRALANRGRREDGSSYDERSAERCACRSGDRRSRPGAPPPLLSSTPRREPPFRMRLRRAQRGALRVPVWRPAFQARQKRKRRVNLTMNDWVSSSGYPGHQGVPERVVNEEEVAARLVLPAEADVRREAVGGAVVLEERREKAPGREVVVEPRGDQPGVVHPARKGDPVKRDGRFHDEVGNDLNPAAPGEFAPRSREEPALLPGEGPRDRPLGTGPVAEAGGVEVMGADGHRQVVRQPELLVEHFPVPRQLELEAVSVLDLRL